MTRRRTAPRTLWSPSDDPDRLMLDYTVGEDRLWDMRLLPWDVYDPAIVAAADYVIDLGPGAGDQGGAPLPGRPRSLADDPRSLTASMCGATCRIPVPPPPAPGQRAVLDASATLRPHNLKGVDARIPIGAFTAVTGVSVFGQVHAGARCPRSAPAGPLPRRRAAGPAIEGADDPR